jgi:hypothetical protein
VISVRMGQDDCCESIPVRSHASQTVSEDSGAKADVDQDPDPSGLDERRVPPRPTGEYGKLDGHRSQIPQCAILACSSKCVVDSRPYQYEIVPVAGQDEP